VLTNTDFYHILDVNRLVTLLTNLIKMETPKSEIYFYQNLGKLFYAIAFSDKVVH